MSKHEVIVEYANGQQQTTYFDHAPQLDVVVRVQGSEAYGRVIAVSPNLDKSTLSAGHQPMNEYC